MEELLSKEEINYILKEAEDPRYSRADTFIITNNKTDIFKVSNQSGLILIHGDEHTRLEHIKLRHSKISNKAYWKNDNKLENQSKFKLGLAPIEYLFIADKIYKSEYKSISKNRRPEVFDVFIADYIHRNSFKSKYTLITYKGTGIIHTFFISDNRKPFNKKKILDLRRGWAYGDWYPIEGKQIIKIPYYNSKDEECLTVIIEYSKITNIEEWFVENHPNNSMEKRKIKVGENEKREHPLLGEDLGSRIMQANYLDDQSWIEKRIKKVLDEMT